MSEFKEKLRQVLLEAESAALMVLGEAAAKQDYEAIDEARAVAQRLRDLAKPQYPAPCPRNNGSSGPRKRPTAAAKSRSRKRAKEYPRFHVADGSLYKTGWSKKHGKEYTHRVPLDRAETIFSALNSIGNTADGPVSVETILKAPEIDMADLLPSYQVYVVLAFLKHHNLVTAVGREGYRLPNAISTRANKLLSELGQNS